MPLMRWSAILRPSVEQWRQSNGKVQGNRERSRSNFWSALRWSGALVLLLIPLIAMQFTSEVTWTAGDFLFAGLTIGGAGLAYELAARTVRGNAYRAAVAVGVGGSVLIIWVNGAVGIIGNEENPANLMFYGVVALGFIGAIIMLARAAAMVWVMSTMAVAQLSVGIAALGMGHNLNRASPDARAQSAPLTASPTPATRALVQGSEAGQADRLLSFAYIRHRKAEGARRRPSTAGCRPSHIS